MAPTRAEGQMSLNLAGLSTITEPPTNTSKSPFTGPKAANGGILSSARVGAGSPLHDQTSRLFPKRTRELQSQMGIPTSIWGPPTSGTSTPLYEIPESPNQDGFPDFVPLTESGINSPARRGRAGTLPSRISPVASLQQLTSKTSRPSPTTSPFRPGSTSAAESAFNAAAPSSSTSTLLSRLRAGSMPQRANFLGSSTAFGPSAFGSGWSSRARAATLTSISSAEDPTSPQQPGFPRDSITDSDVRTLDYLGLAEPPQQSRVEPLQNSRGISSSQNQNSNMSDLLANLQMRNANRFRSFSVNAQPKYGADSQETGEADYSAHPSGVLTPSKAAAIEAEYELVQEKVRLHNQAVQAFAVNANAARPRARTAGLVETPQRTSFLKMNNAGLNMTNNGEGFISAHGLAENTLSDSFQTLNITDGLRMSYDNYDDVESQISRSLWIGSIPNSTTMSSLDAIFNQFGPIESTRVLTHKNCGFVNFAEIDDAVHARQILNGKELFPGAGPVRIGFAKAPTSVAPSHDAVSASPAPELGQSTQMFAMQGNLLNNDGIKHDLSVQQQSESLPVIARLSELQPDILSIVMEFGTQQNDYAIITSSLDSAISFQQSQSEIPPTPEPSPTRLYDAPKLRDIRKRIDNGACGLQEIEQIAIDMLPEIAELSSDYLGNTVVQKLFEFSSEQTKDQMLAYIAPHLAEIGVHKNGTWAAQKIIDVCRTENQMRMIVDSLRPYTVPLFLDQYGNYVVQCCLRFGSPYNDFIFETMLSQLWEVAQGRFGARAMRACLESHHATKQQQRMLAAAVALCSVQLATNPNGALLLTWLLDTCTFPRRRSVLAPRLVPHLVQLCTHKVAYLTVLKVINQRNELEARDMILTALFFSQGDSILEQILCDQTSGATLIFKILTSPYLDDGTRPEVVRNVSKVLSRIKAQPNQGYKRLMDEVGLSSRQPQPSAPPFTNTQDRARPNPHSNTAAMQQPFQRQYNGNFVPSLHSGNLDNGMSPIRTGSADSFGYPPYSANGVQSQSTYGQMPFQHMSPHTQYPSYPGNMQRNNNAYMTNGFTGYATPPSSVDAFRNMQNQSSPLPFPAQMSPVMNSGFGQPSYSQNMYNYAQQQHQYFYPPSMQSVNAGGRGRRVSQTGITTGTSANNCAAEVNSCQPIMILGWQSYDVESW